NDGAMKVGYTAPSQEGQAKVIRAAQLMAEVEPETITYMETHGTGTALGDPIEVAAMTQAFRASTDLKQFCAIGSVKTNIGHLDAAAGITGFIKTVLALHHKRIPPSLHFEKPNPQIDFANSPFYVNTQLTEWETNGTPRRAGVSSFGFGGTNVHAILEEAPPPLTVDPATPKPRAYQLLALSTKTAATLDRSTVNLSDRLQHATDLNLADVAYTLQVGRWALEHRRIAVVSTLKDAVEVLNVGDSDRVFTGQTTASNPLIMFLFPGQGSQYVNMGRELYESEATFRSTCDRCISLLQSQHQIDIRPILFADRVDLDTATHQLTQTAIAQPAIFTIEYALAQLWMSWGVTPQGAIGHSIGEYVAACLAGVFSLEDALTIVATRGRLMQQQPTGTMIAVNLSIGDLQPLLDDSLHLAASNSPDLSVVSGTVEAISGLESLLATRGITCKPLHTSHAFHSPLMEGAIEPFIECLRGITLNPPQLLFISNVTGTWITAAAATDPLYWAQHLRQPVQFSAGIAELLTNPDAIFLEVGAGRTLGTLTKQQAPTRTIFCSLPHPQDKSSDLELMLKTLGQLWLNGVEIDWTSFYADRQCQRVPLPTYPFDRQRYWIDAPALNEPNRALVTPVKKTDIGDWFYVPSWKRSTLPTLAPTDRQRCWVIFSDLLGFATVMTQRLQQRGERVIEVKIGTQFSHNNDIYTIDPGDLSHYETLMRSILEIDRSPIITHLWTLGAVSFDESQTYGFYSLLYLAQAIGQQNSNEPIHIGVVTGNSQDVTGTETIQPEKATILGACRVIPQEYPNISCCTIDLEITAQRLEVVASGAKSACADWDIDRTIADILAQATTPSDSIVAYRGNYRWLPIAEPLYLEPVESPTSLRERGTYLITGGMGGIGLTIAQHLAQTVPQPKLILIGRSPFPAQTEWVDWLTSHDETEPISSKIRQIQSLQAIGAEILVLNADVADLVQMAAIQGQIQQTYGQINGIFHTAGIPGDGIIQLKTPETAASVMRPKVQGTLVLDRIYRDKNLDFLVLFSSHSALLGGMGQIDYCAANSFLDAFALAQNRNYRSISINWDIWQEVGMGADLTGLPAHLQPERLAALATGISPTAGWEALQRILHSDLDRAIVSTQDWQTVLKQQQQRTVANAETPQPSPQPTAAAHTRRVQSTAYIAPSIEIEQRIAQLWQTQLGIAQIGANDNFFELGGHSLLAVRVVSQLREIYPVDLSLRTLLSEAPTVAGLAAIIADLLSPADDPDEMIRLLAEIENLSIDEVRDRLAQEEAIS
ncbi:SDR family NAD(P)-dependent oxidoreductase, partial [Chamaesiphon sp. OTE_8_metabat_110]|uniref:type I polyketide synthase n=1 Tax=Chamaesiphon sp. OTE_8_metabat_110 TaxID=2964696 RepID=UPI00286CA2C2